MPSARVYISEQQREAWAQRGGDLLAQGNSCMVRLGDQPLDCPPKGVCGLPQPEGEPTTENLPSNSSALHKRVLTLSSHYLETCHQKSHLLEVTPCGLGSKCPVNLHCNQRVAPSGAVPLCPVLPLNIYTARHWGPAALDQQQVPGITLPLQQNLAVPSSAPWLRSSPSSSAEEMQSLSFFCLHKVFLAQEQILIFNPGLNFVSDRYASP